MMMNAEANPTPNAAGHEAGALDEALFADLVEAARWAPSPDNNQPWAFRSAGNEVQVLHVRRRAVRSDCRDLFSWLAIGAAVENIVLQASNHRIATKVVYHDRPFPHVAGLEHVAEVKLLGGDVEPDPLAEQIKSRCTNRKPYRKKPPERETLRRLEEAVGNGPVGVRWFVERSEIKRVAKLIGAADRIRFEHQPFHEELHEVLRYTPEQVEQTRDGLDVRTLELPGFMGRVLRWLRPWPRMRRLNRLGFSRLLARMSAKQAAASGALAMLSTRDNTDQGYLEAGRAIQRLWLAATGEGLAVQYLGALPLFLLTLSRERDKFAPGHVVSLESIATQVDPPDGDQQVMLLRLGHAPPPSHRSIRYLTGTLRSA